ncbi:transposase [Wolbachia endosymbiont of Encarsia formosa]|uniref:transposase n=1 Tax=Wolbachia endosymbiont of Encarsia formosa TaxID=77125 RepID=UPI0031BB9DCE
MLKKIVSVVRQNNVWKEKTSFCIVDAQSVKNADNDEEKSYDAGKKISGIKRHIAQDIDVCYLFLSLFK